jgi:hypothetical protein
MKNNPQRRTAIIWAIITAAAIIGIFVPSIIGLEGFDGGFAISTLAFFMALTGVIVVIVYLLRARTLDRMFQGDNLLTHWTYTSEEWSKYTEQEYKTEKYGKWKLFFLVAGIALFIGIVFFIIDNEAGLVVLYSMLGLIALIALVAWASSLSNYRHNKKTVGEVFISRDAVYMNRQFHTWKGLGAKLKSVLIASKDDQSVLAFSYTMPTRTGIQEYTVRVPVPYGKDKAAETLVQDFQELIKPG